ncbi:hypothetical protein D9M71_741550 [compost metagenome]
MSRRLKSAAFSICTQWPHSPNTCNWAWGIRRISRSEASSGITWSSRPWMIRVGCGKWRSAASSTASISMPCWRGAGNNWAKRVCTSSRMLASKRMRTRSSVMMLWSKANTFISSRIASSDGW